MQARSIGAISVLLLACSASGSDAPAVMAPSRSASPVATEAVHPADERVAYFAGGCFWGVEHFLEQLEGVIAVESGYMGGHIERPTYEQVSSQTSGHLETVRVRFDSTRVSYQDITKRFFEIHDPTQANGQGPDIGPEYLSVVFYTDEQQKQAAETLINRLVARGYAVVTKVRPAQQFWEAEDYHQNYYAKTGKTPYCHSPVKRFGE